MFNTNSPKVNVRSVKGTAIAETPAVLLVLFMFLAFPMINLGMVGYRTYFLINSAREAAHRASRSLTYSQPVQNATLGNNTPAVKVARDTVDRYIGTFNGVKVQSVQTGMVVVNNITGSKQGPFYNPIPLSAARGAVVYIEVKVEGEAAPMVTYLGGLLGPIPGITSPVKIQTHAREVFENQRGIMM